MKFFLQFLVLMMLVSCQKNEFDFVPDQTSFINRDLLLAELVGSPRSYILNVSDGGNTIFYGYDQTIVEIPSEALLDESGSTITGEVKLEIKEFTSSKSNLLQCPPSKFDMGILNSDKLLYIKFSKDGKDIFPHKKINIFVETLSHISDPIVLSGTLTDNMITWSRVNESLAKVSLGQWSITSNESQSTINGYKLELKGSPRWISITERPTITNPTQQRLNIIPSQHLNQKNTLAFFIADDKNTMLPLVWNEAKSNFGLAIVTQNMNVSGKIMLISQLGDNYFEFGMTNAVLGTDTDLKVKSEKKSIQEIKSILSSI